VITLRPVETTDIDAFYEHQADPVAAEMAAFPARDRAAHVEHWLTRVLPNPSNVTRTVVVDGEIAGNIGSWLDPDGRRLVGYVYGREFWGRGIATEALRMFAADLHDRPLYAYVARTNAGSRRVLEKSGFEFLAEDVAGDGVEEFLFVLN
jgi:RimJ/RimL family protein N-acetyltransferase